MMPSPPGRSSKRLAGHGFTISSARKSRKPSDERDWTSAGENERQQLARNFVDDNGAWILFPEMSCGLMRGPDPKDRHDQQQRELASECPLPGHEVQQHANGRTGRARCDGRVPGPPGGGQEDRERGSCANDARVGQSVVNRALVANQCRQKPGARGKHGWQRQHCAQHGLPE